MKYLIVIPRMGGGGAERVASLLANRLSEEHEITILTLVSGESFYPLSEKVRYEGIGVSVNRKNKLTTLISKAMFFPKALLAIHRKLKSNSFDVVISLLTEADILVGLCRFFGDRFQHVCSERNDPTKRSAVQLFFLNWIYSRADLFICQGKRVLSFYQKVPAEVKRVIPNPIRFDMIPMRKIPETRRIVSVGRLNYQKNFPLLIQAFSRIASDFPEYQLEIFGEGPERQRLQQRIDELDLTERILLSGAKKNVLDCIADAAIFVLPSDFEGFPNALLEAMAIGLPVISTDFPTGIASELVEEENGIVIPVGDEEALALAMRRLLSSEKLRLDMGCANREKCKAYDVETVILLWKEALETLF